MITLFNHFVGYSVYKFYYVKYKDCILNNDFKFSIQILTINVIKVKYNFQKKSVVIIN